MANGHSRRAGGQQPCLGKVAAGFEGGLSLSDGVKVSNSPPRNSLQLPAGSLPGQTKDIFSLPPPDIRALEWASLSHVTCGHKYGTEDLS